MKKIAITGANGYLAALIQANNQNNYEFIPVTRKDVDLIQPEAVTNFFENLEFDLVLHTAARTQTVDCETNPLDTYKVNTESPINIAKVCQQKDARFIFLSTEQVFNQRTERNPYSEETLVDSSSIYGQQKINVENFLLENEIDAVTLRLSWMMGLSYPGIKSSPNIIKKVMDALFYQKPTKFTVNEVRGMTYANNLAEQFDKIVNLPNGIYHFSSQNNRSTYESAKYLASVLGFNEATIVQYILPDYNRYADRFRNLRLATDKIEAQGIQISTFENDLDRCLTDFDWKN
ncbi:SDR family oxidoreductase [Enterococcus xiangfangensis]|uniref:SDR family oxidoreductase n=1 Tax=Enterococcus xiangfangensis TaxID=1296537 RepID=UPI0010F512FA|nr:sugar nucleotide-binding protein [Enterococcus xiangfangensis]MBM7711178.1 dTDP-4-dehydrorhamnose reductase [Enterococcus xiangfangensis]NBK09240.1 NAD-dependent epimerase/dehydratase family protein [Enterococcus asini]